MSKAETILNPYWVVSDDYNMLDAEFQSYVIKGAKRKYESQLESGKADNLYEVTLHMLNLNSMIGDRRIFDRDMKPCDKATQVSNFVDNYFEADEKKVVTPAKRIYKMANKSMVETLGKYLGIATKIMGSVEIAFRNKKAHLEPVIYLVVNVTGCGVYDVWRIELDIKKDVAGDIRNIGSFEAAGNKETEFTKFIEAYNKRETDKSTMMKMDNTVLMSMPVAHDHQTAATVVKDTLLYNKLFVGDAEMNLDILMEMRDVILKEAKFPYKLTMK
jgi:hypothetical protein